VGAAQLAELSAAPAPVASATSTGSPAAKQPLELQTAEGAVAEQATAETVEAAPADGQSRTQTAAPAAAGKPGEQPAQHGGAEQGTSGRGHAAPASSPAPAADKNGEEPNGSVQTAQSADQSGATPAAPAAASSAPAAAPVSTPGAAPTPGPEASASVQAAQAPATSASAPAGETRESAPPAPAVRVQELPEATDAAIRLAVRDGRTVARITLRPAELGEVQIRLNSDGNAVSATVIADSATAVEALVHASAELKRSLEAQGLTVQSLDVRQSGDEPAPTHERGGNAERFAGRRDRQESDGGEPDDDSSTTEQIQAPLAGVGIDVLA
jgi:flagellar hook-length control protein FliK